MIGTSPDANPDTNPDPGGLTITIEDSLVEIAMTGGDTLSSCPSAPSTICRQRVRTTRPAATVVSDERPRNGARPSRRRPDRVADRRRRRRRSCSSGITQRSLARVEVGADHVPAGYRATRGDIEEVFRTVVGESVEDRRSESGPRRRPRRHDRRHVLRRTRNHATIGARRGPIRRRAQYPVDRTRRRTEHVAAPSFTTDDATCGCTASG